MNQKGSPLNFAWGAAMGLAGGIIGAIGGAKDRRAAKAAEAKSRAEMDRMKQSYMDQDLSNPYANMQNQFAGMKNQFAGMENTMEDLTVNQQEAQFMAEQQQQQQANIMDTLGASAGGSGIAALAQQMAQQGQLANQQAAASIGAQESANQSAAAAQAGQLQQLAAQGAADVDQLSRQGQADVDSKIAAGEQTAQTRELERTGTLLGMAQQETAAYQQQQNDAQARMFQGISGGIDNLPGFIQGLRSDRRLKKNIKIIGKSDSGLNIYVFEYINKAFGKGTYQGVMSDDIPKHAVIKHADGYDRVDYSKLDVEFKNINHV